MAFDYIPLWDRYMEYFEPLEPVEIGRLVLCMLRYKAGGDTEPEGNERFIWPLIRRDIDAARTAYEETCRRQSENGAKGGRPKKPPKPTAFSENPKNPVVFSENPLKATETQKKPPKATETQKSKYQSQNQSQNQSQSQSQSQCHSPNGESNAPVGAAPANEAKKAFGQFGWVKLTESEYNRLLNDLGEAEVKRCIAYVDESAQSTNNKNRWRDWNLVLRRCSRDGWGTQSGPKKAIAPMPAASHAPTTSTTAWLRQEVEKFHRLMGNLESEEAGR